MAKRAWYDMTTDEEERRIMRALRRTLERMGVQQKTALLAVAKELASPGSVYEMAYNSGTAAVAQQLGLT